MLLDGSKMRADDQRFLWRARWRLQSTFPEAASDSNCRHKIQELFPQMLVALADCPLVYTDRERLCAFYMLLREWPPLNVDTAIELLDVRFPDRYVRALAVQHLDRCLDNDQLQLYLLPLIQVRAQIGGGSRSSAALACFSFCATSRTR